MVVVVPVLYYLLVVRRAAQNVTSLFLLTLLCVVRAFFLFPAIIHNEFVLVGAEAGIILLIWVRIRQGLRAAKQLERTSDVLQHIEEACRAVLPVGSVAHFLASELAVFYYALFSWRARASRSDATTFSTHVKGGKAVLLMLLARVAVVEVPIMHILVMRWNHKIAWSITALGVYGVLWLVGLSRSLSLRPVAVSESFLDMYKGFLWRVHVSWHDVVAVKRVGPTTSLSKPGFLNLAIGSNPDFVVELAQPVTAQGPFGITKQVSSVGLSIDEAQSFEQFVTLNLKASYCCESRQLA